MWTVEYLKAAVDDLKKLDRSQSIEIVNKINQVASNPLPKNEGGYGDPLGSRSGADLTGYCKIKLLKLGIRVVYRLEKSEGIMKIVVISARAADEVYRLAIKRIQK